MSDAAAVPGAQDPAMIKNRLDTLSEIPTLPTYVTRLMEVLNSERTGARDVAALVKTDLSLTAKVLKLANSAYYGRFKKVATVEQAITTIGFLEIKSICLSIGVFGCFKDEIDMENLCSFWVHALMTATAVQLVGEHKQECGLDRIYYAGLLHDIGKLVLLSFFEDDYMEMLRSGYMDAPSLKEEKARFGANHAQVGKWLCQHWAFPNDLTEMITHHHHPEKSTLLRPRSTATVFLANQLSHAYEPDSTADRQTKACLKLLGIPARAIEDISGKVQEQRPRIEETFSALHG